MKQDISEVLKKNGVQEVIVKISFRDAWSTDKISKKGKEALQKFGLAPPPSKKIFSDLDVLERAICPRCEGTNTELKNLFGPTLCRAIHYCRDCKEAFEQFKPL
jgi:ring-1,2-phenylacetyl-CoA epoxidase subunit PaaD